MRQRIVLADRPRARTLVIYYAIALAVIAASAACAVAAYAPDRQETGPNGYGPLIGLTGGAVVLAFVGWIHLEMRLAVYTVTENTAHARQGVIAKSSETIQLGSVRSIKVKEGPAQRIFNLGDVILFTTSSDRLVFHDLDRPEEKKELIWSAVRAVTARTRDGREPDR